jgi:hypothetical protein
MVKNTASSQLIRRLALFTAGAATACMGFLAISGGETASADHVPLPMTPSGSGELTPGPSVAPSKIDCMDPNNSINCTGGPNLDSPLVPGTAAPGSPFRD